MRVDFVAAACLRAAADEEPETDALEADITLAPKNLRISASLSRWANETWRRDTKTGDSCEALVPCVDPLSSGYLRERAARALSRSSSSSFAALAFCFLRAFLSFLEMKEVPGSVYGASDA